MKTDARTAANAYIDLFPKPETEIKQENRFTAEHDEEIMLNNLRFAENIFPDNGLMLCPLSHARTKYVSVNCERILGHAYEVLLKMDLPDFFALVHPEDLTAVQQCLHFIRTCEPYDPATHRFIMHYRIKNQAGKYITIRDEKLAVKTRDDRYLHLILFSSVQEDKFYHVRLTVCKNINGAYLNVYTYNPKQQDKVITPRQHDIVRLVIKGFSNQEIADQLRVSVHTVKNHKQMLFKKINVKSSVDLANYVRESSL